MLKRIRNSFYTKVMAVYIVFSFVGDIIYPVISYGLTSGPVDINQASFEPAATSEMVNLATGDFTYNIPLMDVDGYPINISYHGGVSMEQEASIVGLGWSINVGAMNRMKKGLPDDFNGDEIETTMNLRPRTNTTASIGVGVEIVGKEGTMRSGEKYVKEKNIKPSFGVDVGITFSNYYGYGLDIGADAGLAFGKKSDANHLGLGLSATSSSQGGMSISPYASYSRSKNGKPLKAKSGIGFTWNSVQGLQTVSATTGVGLKDKEQASMGIGTTGVIPVSTVSYTPSISFETNTRMQNYNFDLGLEFGYTTWHGRGAFSRSITCLDNSVQVAKAYGYMYEQNKKEYENYLLDVNKDGTVVPNEHIAYLPVTNHTYDVFSASAQGVGFSSRPHRSDVLVVSETFKKDDITGFGLSGELSLGMAPVNWQAGLNINTVFGYSRTGKWDIRNDLDETFELGPENYLTDSEQRLYEQFYFKKFGNRSTSNTDFQNGIQNESPIRQEILKEGNKHYGTNYFWKRDNYVSAENLYNFNDKHYKRERDLRNTNIQYLTAKEMLDNGVLNYPYSIDNDTGYVYLDGYPHDKDPVIKTGITKTDLKEHHLSEMTVLKGDGSRYVYGVPVMNTTTQEVTFNVSNEFPINQSEAITHENEVNFDPVLNPQPVNNTKDCVSGLVSYVANVDNSISNRRGDNNLFIRRDLPASANSFLLTSYLSSNYIDRLGDGPTPDDLGGYTKFNYSKVGTMNWRFPFEENQAMYNQGLASDPYDDMGSYLYGERDQWLTHSIESKNFVAEFHYSERDDAFGVVDENGGIANENVSKKLDYISLYTIKGKENGEAPIKTVHFEYNYDLCQGVPNNVNGGGKLTLTGIYFTYGNSNRGRLHKYTFDYGTGAQNPSYATGKADRWGSYLPSVVGAGCSDMDELNNFEYPYATQDKVDANINAGVWMLKTIHLPSGSEINIEIESDDYSYIQNRKASQMFMVSGMSSDGLVNSEDNLLFVDKEGRNYLHIDLSNENLGTNQAAALNTFNEKYIGNLTKVYYKYLVSITDEKARIDGNEKFEYVSGYADVDHGSIAVLDSDGDQIYDTGVIKLLGVGMKDKDVSSSSTGMSPISKASWQFIRKYLPRVLNAQVGSIYTQNDNVPYDYNCDFIEDSQPPVDDSNPAPTDENMGEGQDLKNLYNIGKSQLQNLISMGGINYMMRKMGYASEFEPKKSWVRLYEGSDNKKIGGGHRVKQITVNDNWDEVTNEVASQYGTVYSYERLNDAGQYVISSGVASYEPISSGADENTFREEIDYSLDIRFRVNDDEYQEKPIGESIFASSQVVYSKVQVRNIEYAGIDQDATGSTEYEFYTAKDFPSFVNSTGRVNNNRLKSESALAFITGQSVYNLTMSQGYSIQVNDMHGKFKGKTVYSAGVTPTAVYSLKHKYYTGGDNSVVLNNSVLSNKLPVINESGVISLKNMGKDIDMVVDAHMSESFNQTMNAQYGVDVSPAPIPSFWFSMKSQHNTFQSSVTTKVVYSNGILEEIELIDKGRVKRSKNLLFDEKTGVPVVTEITPETGSDPIPIYQYDYPAYWVYKGMGLASENWGATFRNIQDPSGYVSGTFKPFLNPGDELIITKINGTSFGKCWVVEDEITKDYYLQKLDGSELVYLDPNGDTYDFRVIRSGKRNLLGSTFQSVTALDNNVVLNFDPNNGDLLNASSPYDASHSHSQVLNASAVQYTQKAFGYLSGYTGEGEANCGLIVGNEVNPYIEGLRGNWNLLESYVYDSDRIQNADNSRIDGVLADYIEYWINNNDIEWILNTDPLIIEKWITAATATLFDGEGYNLESKDALGIYSSILLGYNNTLKVAEAVNSRYYEIGFDGFEDRDYDLETNCSKNHFRFTGEIADEAHTGQHSIKVLGTQSEVSIVSKANSIDHITVDHGKPYTIQEQEIIKQYTFLLSETDTKKYVLTAWVKEDITAAQVTDYNANLSIAGATIIKESRSNIIDGWQRIEIIVEFQQETIVNPINVNISLNATVNDCYFDDVRLQPYNSEMVSYVIDPVSLRLWATLDSRNFATFYQYDEEGSLVRIIQETERGKVTVQENRAGIKINPTN